MARVRSVSVSIDAPSREAPRPTRGPDGRSIAIPSPCAISCSHDDRLVGVGLLGTAVAGEVRKAGHRVVGFDTAPDRWRAGHQGGEAAASARAVALASEAVCTLLPTLAAVETAISGPTAWRRRKSGQVVIQMSTISPALSVRLAPRAGRAPRLPRLPGQRHERVVARARACSSWGASAGCSSAGGHSSRPCFGPVYIAAGRPAMCEGSSRPARALHSAAAAGGASPRAAGRAGARGGLEVLTGAQRGSRMLKSAAADGCAGSIRRR